MCFVRTSVPKDNFGFTPNTMDVVNVKLKQGKRTGRSPWQSRPSCPRSQRPRGSWGTLGLQQQPARAEGCSLRWRALAPTAGRCSPCCKQSGSTKCSHRPVLRWMSPWRSHTQRLARGRERDPQTGHDFFMFSSWWALSASPPSTQQYARPSIAQACLTSCNGLQLVLGSWACLDTNTLTKP